MITKKAKVIMLPTKQQSKYAIEGQISLFAGKLTYISKLYTFGHPMQRGASISQELYLITDDKIKKGDWVYNISFKSIRKAISNDKANIKKIIATTDKSLKFWTDDENGKHIWSLPQPSQAFIEKYCKVGGIDEVLVEYNKIQKTYDELAIEGLSDNPFEINQNKIKLKIDSHNTITIHPIKDSWTRKELLSFGNKCFIAGGKSVANKTYQGYDEYLETIDV